jgi:hypothetical protein
MHKVTSGSTSEITEVVDSLYASLITAASLKADSIRVAEAAMPGSHPLAVTTDAAAEAGCARLCFAAFDRVEAEPNFVGHS